MDGTRLAFTTDSYVVRPLIFPGGDIAQLAVNGTVNDLAMCGARPLVLSVGLIVEEGLPLDLLRRLMESLGRAAAAAGVCIVIGDTKVVDRGKGDGLFINTAGVGVVVAPQPIEPSRVRPGDAVLISGDIGRHGIAIMASREGLAFETTIESDCARLSDLVLEPLYVANEGRFVAFVAPGDAERALALLRTDGRSAGAARIGEVGGEGTEVFMTGPLGTARVIDLPSGEQLPRIC